MFARRLLPVIRRRRGIAAGAYDLTTGEWVSAAPPAPVMVYLGVQPASASDYQARAESTPAGDRAGEMIVAYSSVADRMAVAGRDGALGDLVMHDGAAWLVIGGAVHDALNSVVSHVRHVLVRQNPGEDDTPVPPP